MKLIQKYFLKGTHEFELFEDSIVVRTRKVFKNTTNSISLASLDPNPEIKASESMVYFNHRHIPAPVFSLSLNKPDTQRFESFIEALQWNIIRLNKKQSGKTAVIEAYSQRLTKPYSGLVQIAESDRARALTMDGKTWEFQYIHHLLATEGAPGNSYRRRFSHAFTVDNVGLEDITTRSGDDFKLDESLIELARFISNADFPFPNTDIYEFWLLDPKDDSPLAMIFSCSEAEQMSSFPNKTEWTALSSAAMPIELTPDEKEKNERNVNIRVEEMVAERAGFRHPKAQWFKRHPEEKQNFPPFLLTEDWQDQAQLDLCRRYIDRQSSRLLMLHNLSRTERQRLEIAARPHVFEVERFYPFYPEIVDEKILNPILVEARLRRNSEGINPASVQNRRDGIHYL